MTQNSQINSWLCKQRYYWTFDWCGWSGHNAPWDSAQQFLCTAVSANDFFLQFVIDVYGSFWVSSRYNKILYNDSQAPRETVSDVSSWPKCYTQLYLREHWGPPESENIDSGCGSVSGSAGFGAAGTVLVLLDSQLIAFAIVLFGFHQSW